MLSINNNLLAANTANNLTSHYGSLAKSTQRLSSGLRINSAADDAAGLAIRELMRCDIAALRQGMRNVNDGISMIQTMDGALGVIDEKLIRMKELAEQAATGTYDSTQRLMIDSEFQAMGEEINRIARATDFNGIKLLDGKDVAGANGIAVQAEVTVGDKTFSVDGTSSFVSAWPGVTATQVGGNWDFSGITNPEALLGTTNISISNLNIPTIGGKYLLVSPTGGLSEIPPGTNLTIEYLGHKDWVINGFSTEALPDTLPPEVTISSGWNTFTFFDNRDPNAPIRITANVYDPDKQANASQAPVAQTNWTSPLTVPAFSASVTTTNASRAVNTTTVIPTATPTANGLQMTIDLGNGNTITGEWEINGGDDKGVSAANVHIEIKDITPKPDEPAGPTDPDNPLSPNYKIPDDVIRIHFGSGADKKEDFYDLKKHDATLKGLGLEGVEIKTQDAAQEALVQVNDAIVAKDKIRAEYGAMQNRMENTLTNLSIQAENLQAAESRISDAEVAQEMMNFVRNQILTQSAVAMLTQANSLPQMVLSLIN